MWAILRVVDDLLAINDRQVRTADAVPGQRTRAPRPRRCRVPRRSSGRWLARPDMARQTAWQVGTRGRYRGDAGPEGAGRGAELGVLDERRAQPVAWRGRTGCRPSGPDSLPSRDRTDPAIPSGSCRWRRTKVSGAPLCFVPASRGSDTKAVTVSSSMLNPAAKSDVGGQAAVRERTRRYGPDPVSQLLRRTAFGPLGECALIRVGIEAGRTDGRIGGDARGHHRIQFAATGGNPPVARRSR